MRTTGIHRASEAEGFGVYVDKPLCSKNLSSDELKELYTEDAEHLFNGLIGSLPGGTVDALLVEMLDHHRSLLVVSYKSLEDRKESDE